MAAATSESSSFSLARLLATLAVIAVIAAAAYYYGVNSVQPPGEDEALRVYGMDDPQPHKLSDAYTDADGDLVADPPADESRWVDPEVLQFSYLASDQDRYQEVWSGFIDHLSQATGKPVEYLVVDSTEDQLLALKEGQLHVTGINAGATPIAVNECGFVPVCGFGRGDELASYTMQIITRPESAIAEVSDLAGNTLTLTNPTSNSGWKAPLALLRNEHKLLPVRDFAVIYSNGHAESLQGLTGGLYEVIAVASDEVELAVQRGQVSKDDLKVIYESEPFPNNLLGHAYDLKPELAEQLRTAMLSFDWDGSKLAEEFSVFGAENFTAISYKDDLELIRQIHNQVGGRQTVRAAGFASQETASQETPETDDRGETDADN